MYLIVLDPADVFHKAILGQLRTPKTQHFGVFVPILVCETQALGTESQKYLGMLNPTDSYDQVTQLQLPQRLELKGLLSLLRRRFALLRILPIIYGNKEPFQKRSF